MSFIRELATVFCVCAVVLGAIGVLSPQNAFQKPMKVILGLVFIATIVAVFGNGFNLDFSFEIESNPVSATLSETTEKQIVATSENIISDNISSLLKKNGYSDFFVNIKMDISDKAGISISMAEIYFDTESDVNEQTVASMVKNSLGIEVAVLYC
ncbi:MAG: hypothetical protein PHV07_04875 [Oscillospiraceae bacterium]|nr:hypothetical protein [Oscillospiraceae bacterium]